MNLHLSGATITVFIGLGIILLVAYGIMTWTIWTSIRLIRVEPSKLRFLFAIAFLQILFGGLTIYGIKQVNNEPAIAIGAGLGVMILSGFLLIKLILQHGWNRSLRLWAIATGMQLVFVPVCSFILLAGLALVSNLLYPPQF